MIQKVDEKNGTPYVFVSMILKEKYKEAFIWSMHRTLQDIVDFVS